MTTRPRLSWAVGLVAVLAVGLGLVGAHFAAGDPDPAAFQAAGQQLLSSRALHVFHDPYLQIGPVYLLAEGLLSDLAGWLRLSPLVFTSVFWCGVLMTWIGSLAGVAVIGTSTAVSARDRAGKAVLIAVALPLPLVACTGHFEELVAGLSLLACAMFAARDRTLPAALLLVLAVGCKSWGVLGFPLLLLASLWRVRLAMAATAVAGMAAVYAPFVLGGDMATGSHVWRVTAPSVLSLFVSFGTPFGLVARAGQVVAVVMTASAAVMFRDRRRPHLVAASGACVIVFALRLLTDPYPQSYYVAPLMVAAVLLALQSAHEPLSALAAALGVTISLDIAFALPGVAGSFAQLAAGCLALAVGYRTIAIAGHGTSQNANLRRVIRMGTAP